MAIKKRNTERPEGVPVADKATAVYLMQLLGEALALENKLLNIAP